MATRNGSAQWRGDLRSGEGEVEVGDGALSAPYSFASRFRDGQGTNPEELIAAAHAGCFSMALANMLAEHGHPAQSIRTQARVELRVVDGAPTLTAIRLETQGDVPGIDQDHFAHHAEQAKAVCPVSRALAGVERIELTARLTTAGAS
jgi:osmotically inducible protein OsmC